MKLHFAEEILLLLLHDENGKFERVSDWSMRFALAGAQLMELANADRIDTDLDTLSLLNDEPLGMPSLDGLLNEIRDAKDQHDARFWLEHLALNADLIREEMLENLVRRGILHQKEDRFLWVFKSRHYPVVDGQFEREVKLRIMEVLFSDVIPDPHDIALIVLADACGILRSIFSDRTYEGTEDRIMQIRQMDLIGRAMNSAIDEIEISIATAGQSQFY